MIYNIINLPLIVRLFLFSAINISLGFCITKERWIVCIVLGILCLFSIIELIKYLNGISRKVAYFFDAIRNEDSTLHFPEKVKDKSFRELHGSLNRLNSLISDIKLKNESNERFFRQLLKYSSTGIFAVDENEYIDLINDSALDMLGVANLVHFDLVKQKNPELYRKLMLIKQGTGNTIKVFDGSGLKLLSVKVAQLKFGDKSYKVFSMYDIKNELEEKELDTWQKLISVLTHEIMNSIAPITSLSNSIRRIFISGDKVISKKELQQESINKALGGLTVIEETGKGLMNFVDRYRKLTKIPKPAFKPILVDEWLNKVYLLMKDRIEKEQIEFSLVNNNVRKEFHGDEKLLTQVAINIMNNAIDALEGKSQKMIQVTTAYRKNNGLEIKITDNGKGIDTENLEKIFIPFFTTRENGSGIGLSLSRQIMRLHKGTIEVYSKPDKYTTFVLKI